MVNFKEWNVERIWHFMSGLCSRRREPLRDTRGKEIGYRSVLGYSLGNYKQEPGTVVSTSFGWNLNCLGGSIQLGRAYKTEEANK